MIPQLKPILVIGESCIDISWHCHIERLCPEAPVPVLVPKRKTHNDGMAKNVIANLVSLGATDVELLTHNSAIRKTRYVDEQSGYIIVRIDEGDSDVVRVTRDLLDEKLNSKEWSAIMIVDYDKGFLEDDDIAYISRWAKARKIPTTCDTKKILNILFRDVTFIKINQKEYDLQLKAIGDPSRFCENLIVTKGAAGSWWMNKDATVPTRQVNVADLSGCGDCWHSAFVLKYLHNNGNVLTAMEYANRVASTAASRRGIIAVDAADVDFP